MEKQLYTALHMAVEQSDYNLVQLFLDHGAAHMDQMVVFGKDQPMERLYQQLRKKGDCPIEEIKYINLRCLAARTIVDNNIDYKKSIAIPLHGFVEKHRLDERGVPSNEGRHFNDVYEN